MLMKNLFNRKSVFASILLSYLVILVIELSLSGLFYFMTSKNLKTEIEKSSSVSIKNFGETIDNNLMNMMQFTVQLEKAFESELKKAPGLLDTETAYDLRDVSARLLEYSMYNNFIDEFYICYNQDGKQMILSSRGRTEAENLYYLRHSTTELSYETWSGALYRKNAQDFVLFPYNNSENDGVLFVRSYHDSTGRVPDFNIAAMVFSAKFFGTESLEDNFFAVTKRDGTLFYLPDRGRTPLIEELLNAMPPAVDHMTFPYDGQQYLVHRRSSTATNWDYLQVASSSLYWQPLRQNWILFVSNLLVCALLGLVTAFFFARRNYKPISEIISLIPAGAETGDSRGRNEFSVIANSIHSMAQSEQQLRRLANSHSEMLKALTLERVLCNYVNTDIPLEDILAAQELSFPYPYFFVGILAVTDYSKLFPEADYNKETSRSTVNFLLQNVLSDILAPEASGPDSGFIYETLETHAVLALIFNTANIEDRDRLAQYMGQIIRFFKNELEITVISFLSTPQKKLADLPAAFEECLRSVSGCRPRPSAAAVSGNYYHYTKEDEARLIQYIKNGEVKRAQDYLLVLLERNLSNDIPFNATKCFLYDILVSVFHSLDERDPLHLVQRDMVKQIIAGTEYSDTIDAMMRCVDRLAAHHSTKRASQPNSLILQVSGFIEEYYRDPRLCVSMIGDHFGRSPSYISRLFRSEFNISLSDYIAQYKVNKAIELLKNTSMNVKEISDFLGYSNSNVFIRAFKKITGLSPTQYRLSHFTHDQG